LRVLLTGVAGFIGFHTAQTLLENGHEVFGLDSLNDYYDPAVKHARLDVLKRYSAFQFNQLNICDLPSLRQYWQRAEPDHIIHLAAQAGVRYSIENPMAYVEANMVGFQHMIDLAREFKPTNFVYASSSSVYGGNKELPFAESQKVDNPISLYAASKLSNELVANVYSHLYELPSTGLRFFTVYGPFSRPDMAMFKFAELMRMGQPITVYNDGKMIRDWTFVTDIVDGILAVTAKPQQAQVYNLGKGSLDVLSDMIDYLEEDLGLKADRQYLPIQPGDVPVTQADITKANKDFGYQPKVDLRTGVREFAKWYRDFRNVA